LHISNKIAAELNGSYTSYGVTGFGIETAKCFFRNNLGDNFSKYFVLEHRMEFFNKN
jgi:iron complex outermembrane receptor protein